MAINANTHSRNYTGCQYHQERSYNSKRKNNVFLFTLTVLQQSTARKISNFWWSIRRHPWCLKEFDLEFSCITYNFKKQPIKTLASGRQKFLRRHCTPEKWNILSQFFLHKVPWLQRDKSPVALIWNHRP